MTIIDTPSLIMTLDILFFKVIRNLKIFAMINFTNLQIVLINLFPIKKDPSVNYLTKGNFVVSKNLKIKS